MAALPVRQGVSIAGRRMERRMRNEQNSLLHSTVTVETAGRQLPMGQVDIPIVVPWDLYRGNDRNVAGLDRRTNGQSENRGFDTPEIR